MAVEEEHEVVIVGGGIAGLATALGLSRVGTKSLVLERSDELRSTGAALSLFANAWQAMDALGVAHKLTSIYKPLESSRVMNLESGTEQTVYYRNTPGSELGLRAVHRKKLLEALAEELPPGTIRFSSKLASIKSQVLEDSSTVTILHLEDGTVLRAKVVIGCDGVHSVVAQWLGLPPPFSSGRAAVRGLSIFPDGHNFKGVQQFLTPGKRAGVVPLNANEVYWFIVYAVTKGGEQEMARDPELIRKEVIHSLAKDFPAEYLDVVRRSEDSSLTWAPLMLRAPWDVVWGRTHRGNVTVAGDAMHPMTPDLGQGGGMALEDAVVLVRNLRRAAAGGGLEEGIERYVKERRWRVAGLIAGSYLSGWVQQGGEGMWGWLVKFLRDHVFYRFVLPRLGAVVRFDCGTLSTEAVECLSLQQKASKMIFDL